METNLEKKNAGEYMESNHIIFWSGSHPENKIGIYIMGGCDLPSVFSCVPLIKPILDISENSQMLSIATF
jgi:hypothetical protein